ECTNTEGGRVCGGCPYGHLGSGYTKCVPASACSSNNGGCSRDPLVACTDTPSGPPDCGPCPNGYTGDGATGCVEEDGCALAEDQGGGCYPGVQCADSPAPLSGFTCGPCPPATEGNGVTCVANKCFDANGVGYADEFGDGTSCVEEDGCGSFPCFPGVVCTDVAAPGTGATCGECPPGYTTALASSPDEAASLGCQDVDECTSENGECDALTVCTNTQGGRECGNCPAGFLGAGEAGCRRSQTCDTENGGCHELTTCTDVWDGVECGDCPEGYTGSGATTCADTDGCALEPCFPGVACADVAAPGEGRTCGSCPEGYKGDGAACEMCSLILRISGTTVGSGTARRAFQNQVVAELPGLVDPECVPSSETTFQWAGAASDGAVLVLTEEENRAHTLRLNFPKYTLTTYLSYTLSLSAKLTASPQVWAEVGVSFYVEPQALVALVTPSGLETGQDSEVVLDGSASYDPDGEPGEMTFEWRCSAADETGKNSGNCKDRTGGLLPAKWTSASLSVFLLGTPGGQAYSFTLTVRKGVGEAFAVARVTIVSGALPVPTIIALPSKVNANEKLTMASSVESDAADTLSQAWSVLPEEGAAALDLAASAKTPLSQAIMVLRAGVLEPGAAYIFTLHVTDSYGSASSSLRVVVNSPPTAGRVSATPAEGTVLDTLFQVAASDWEDGDAPLWYQLYYHVAGSPVNEMDLLSEYQPLAQTNTVMPQEGAEEFGHVVEVHVWVKDALGAVGSAAANVTVRPVAFAGEAELTEFVDGMLVSSETAMANGDISTTMALVDGVSNLMNTASRRRRRRRHRQRALQQLEGEDAVEAVEEEEEKGFAARQEQREGLMCLVEAASSRMVVSDSSLDRLSRSTQKLVEEPVEVGVAAQETGFRMMDTLVGQAASSAADASITAASADAVAGSLSKLVSAGVMSSPTQDAAAPNPAARGLDTLSSLGATLAGGMVAGEEAAQLATEVLTMRVQKEDLSDPLGGAFSAPLDSPNGMSSVSFPRSMGAAVGGQLAIIELLTTTVDPHLNLSGAGNTTAALRRVLLQRHEDLERGEDSELLPPVTTIALTGVDGEEIAVNGLEEGITFTLPLASAASGNHTAPPPQCSFWDPLRGGYRQAGCAALPTPAPPGVLLHWRTLNVSLVGGENLDRLWTVDGASSRELLEGCTETFEAVYPEYMGTDSGYRKYLGEGCQLADPENNASCWWEWRRQAFLGPGCEWGSHVHCLCTHLTDFKATQGTEAGEMAPPRGSAISASDMTALSTSDLAASATLLSILAGLMGGSVLLAWLSNRLHMQDKLDIYRGLLCHHGTNALWFQSIGEVWTWSLTSEDLYGKGGVLVEKFRTPAKTVVGSKGVHSDGPLGDKGHGSCPPQQQRSGYTAQLAALARGEAEEGARARQQWLEGSSTLLAITDRGPNETSSSLSHDYLGYPSRRRAELVQYDVDDVGRKYGELQLHLPAMGLGDPRGGGGVGQLEGSALHSVVLIQSQELRWPISSAQNLEHIFLEGMDLKSGGPPPPQGAPRNTQSRERYTSADVVDKILGRPREAAVRRDLPVAALNFEYASRRKLTGTTECIGDGLRSTGPRKAPPLRRWTPKGKSSSGQILESPIMKVPAPARLLSDPDSTHGGRGRSGRDSWHVAKKLGLLRAIAEKHLQVEFKKDFTTSEQLCKAVGLDFTKLLLCMPVAELKRQAMVVIHARMAMQSMTSSAGHHAPPLPSPSPSKAAGAHKPAALSRRRPQMLLSFERALGTSLVHAYIRLNSFLMDECHVVHIGGASALPWNTPEGKGFHWFCGVFQEMICRGQGAGWLLRAQLYRLVFLQAANGSYSLSQDLADTLRAGAPLESLADTTRPAYDLRELRRSLPTGLLPRGDSAKTKGDGDRGVRPGRERDAMEGAAGESGVDSTAAEVHADVAARESRVRQAESIWATLLARALYTQLPFTWTHNPQTAPADRVTIGDRMTMWIELQLKELELEETGGGGGGGKAVPSLLAMTAEAHRLVAEWQEAYIQRVVELQRTQRATGGMGMAPLPWWQRAWKGLLASLFQVVSSHPLVAIYLVAPKEAFSRSERLIVQVNVFIVMLGCCMAFYYSRVVTCCVDFQSYVGCAEPSRFMEPPCMGYPTCKALLSSRKGGMLPSEVLEAGFLCTAFPEPTWMGRIWTVLIINAVLIPVNVTLMAMFSLSGVSSRAPGHFSMDGAQKASQLMGPQRGALITNLFLFLYAIFFDIKLVTKTMAMVFMAFFSAIFKPIKSVTGLLKPIVAGIIPLVFWAKAFYRRCVAVPQNLRKDQRNNCETSLYVDPIEKHDVRLSGMVDAILDQMAYGLIAIFWGMTVWILLVYGMLIREIMGPEAEEELVKAWAMALVTEQFGLKALKLMMVRSAGRKFSAGLDQFMVGKDVYDVLHWYEGYIMGFPLQYVSQDDDTFLANAAL
ncbi:hypothetical protein CYMTET_12468, partial [Cymbomonas tetramitiformis]